MTRFFFIGVLKANEMSLGVHVVTKTDTPSYTYSEKMNAKGKDIAVKRKEYERGTLAALPVGETAGVSGISPDCGIKRRLTDLGFCRGEKVTCMFSSPFGDPSAYLIRGTLIALRRSDATRVAFGK